MEAPKPPGTKAATLAATQRLRVDAATAEVLRAFESAGIQAILLKGASIARWLYDEGEPRTFGDCDLLVRPADRSAAQRVLGELGFAPNVDEQAMPGWWREHAVGWLRRKDAAMVDLHQTLSGVAVDPERAWETLSAHVETMDVAGFPAPALTITGRAFHLALHVAQHREWGIKLIELERALEREPEATWRAAADLAARLDAMGAFATGLRAVPAGRDLATRLDLPAGAPVDVVLRAWSAPPVALGFDQLSQAGGLRARLDILRHKVFPPRTFMRSWSRLAHHGRLGMALAYVWRPVWLLMRAPAGFRAWREARRRTT